jgi:hypothetical protein
VYQNKGHRSTLLGKEEQQEIVIYKEDIDDDTIFT